ncbi:N-acetylmuramoyl-L-alanine amidase [Pseudomonas sp. RIT-PI-AD]|uniref:N-acetylmuramoyl-L-alanine amidase n=1 Tax=Pseudomonas sp. RIT-PI-AD TaxID=3035294 RepID=UPI0021DB5728|nr:N-acetylmuramoyl-L-alanine amidase [Pseudomonas sp. RIT-PI-AD]
MKSFLSSLLLLLIAGCAQQPQIDTRFVSANQNSRVQYIVLHYTSTDFLHSLALLTHGDVSAHYLIDEDPPTIYRLVDENRRAWHAGESEWQGRTWLNASSIGIELVNRGYEDMADGRVWYPFAEAQIDALIGLLKDLVKRHQLPLGSIIGHLDIAPQRKVDPGPLFPWKRLGEAGLIPWPDAGEVARKQVLLAAELPNVLWFQHQLAIQGYAVEQNGTLDQATRNVLAAFQMKYRPARYDGEPDAQTAALLLVLNTRK